MTQLNFVFGLGIFLFGMTQLEYGIRKLADARLRYYLKSSTGSKLGSVSTGVITTALLQSSSMVSLLVLAFASASLLPLTNAIGIIIGANLGTTFTGWIVAILGFKLDLEAMALPMLGITGFALAISKRDTKLNHSALVILGIALLLFGLGIMKTSMESIPERFDVSILQGHHPLVYLLFGILITFLVQSSSAVMMMALAALNAEFIALPEAVALIIGADLGTTSTTVLGSLTGSTIKRQLAFAHFSFNFIVDMAAFLLLLPALPLLMGLLSLEDPLYSLVAFHSVMNLLGLVAFVPFLNQFSAWIEKVFARNRVQASTLLDRVSPAVIDASLVALRDTVKQVMLQAACNSLRLFKLKPDQLELIDAGSVEVLGEATISDFSKAYEELRNQEGNILAYTARLQAQQLDPEDALELQRLQLITRHVIFCNKNLKDIYEDLNDLKYATKESMKELYEMHKKYHKTVYERLSNLLIGEHSTEFILEELVEIQRKNDLHTEASNAFVQSHISSQSADSSDLSIQLNSNREIRHAVKTLIKAIDLWVRAESDPGLVKVEAMPR